MDNLKLITLSTKVAPTYEKIYAMHEFLNSANQKGHQKFMVSNRKFGGRHSTPYYDVDKYLINGTKKIRCSVSHPKNEVFVFENYNPLT